MVGDAVGAGVGAVGGAVDVVGGVVGGALDVVGSLPRTIPPLPNPFIVPNIELDLGPGENSIERTMDVDNKTIDAEPNIQRTGFCKKDPVKESLEEVLSSIPSLSDFLTIYDNSNLTLARYINVNLSVYTSFKIIVISTFNPPQSWLRTIKLSANSLETP